MPFPPRSFRPTRTTGEGSRRTLLPTGCHSPKVDVGEKEQQHQGGHDQPAVDELDRNRQHDRRPRSSGLTPRPGNPSSLSSSLTMLEGGHFTDKEGTDVQGVLSR